MKRRLLPLLLSFAMLLTLLPGPAAATALQGDTNGNGTVDVTFTVSQGTDGFYRTQSGDYLIKESLSVPYFDLALYGLQGYYYNPDCYTNTAQTAGTQQSAEGIVTTMHVLIWATERFMLSMDAADCGQGKSKTQLSEHISWEQGAGSAFTTFWNGSTNMNYYLDYQFPLGRPGYGSTCDQQALSDGVAIDVHMITGANVSGSQYSYFKTADGTLDFATVTKGSSETLTLYKTTSSYGTETTSATVANKDVYYMKVSSYTGQTVGNWTKLGTTGTDGKLTLPTTLDAGEYYLSCKGEVAGSDERGPAAFRLTVKDASAATMGDVDGSGAVNTHDVSLVLQYVAKQLDDNAIDTTAADVDGSGTVDTHDASLIMQYVAKIISGFPAEQE